MQNIADSVGVSSITVSRALKTPEKVAEPVRNKILEACEHLGYVPNQAAIALASARSKNIVVLIPSLTNSVFVDILVGIKERLDHHGYHLLIGITGYSLDEEEKLLRNYLQHSPDGLILTGIDHTPGLWAILENQHIPTVHTIETLERDDCWSVGFSQFAAGQAAARHLIECGYQRIGVIGAQGDPRTLRRRDGCRQALEEAGLYDPALEWIVAENSSIALGASLLEQMHREHPDCDALFFCNDDLAQGAIFKCSRLSIAVPDTMAIIGFHDLGGSAWTTPPLTTVATPRYRIGYEAAELLVAHLAGEDRPERHLDLGFEVLPRETTRLLS
ncbi:LacI family transcriptional regulator [Pseudomonas duriflava]|uniref:LacI family transcriptional regulator n=1 Tax=Pseudomonas duriflava TaxID=459528 RepID=A0A562QFF1_9PSED|nr:LacI family DNA-binding transcriptional regulator [Pseudomonas duriflava]TWI55468.1 LacI family transcriptional regulator [Pseudomonas duriflava]